MKALPNYPGQAAASPRDEAASRRPDPLVPLPRARLWLKEKTAHLSPATRKWGVLFLLLLYGGICLHLLWQGLF
jgi:hypothetical protein